MTLSILCVDGGMASAGAGELLCLPSSAGVEFRCMAVDRFESAPTGTVTYWDEQHRTMAMLDWLDGVRDGHAIDVLAYEAFQAWEGRGGRSGRQLPMINGALIAYGRAIGAKHIIPVHPGSKRYKTAKNKADIARAVEAGITGARQHLARVDTRGYHCTDALAIGWTAADQILTQTLKRAKTP